MGFVGFILFLIMFEFCCCGCPLSAVCGLLRSFLKTFLLVTFVFLCSVVCVREDCTFRSFLALVSGSSACVVDSETLENVVWSQSSEGVVTISGQNGVQAIPDLTSSSSSSSNAWRYDRGSSCVSEVTKIELESISALGSYCFYGMSNVESIEFDSNCELESLGRSAFSSCSSLTSLSFPDTSTFSEIPYRCFSGCSALTSVNITSAISSLSSYAFAYCSSLTSLSFPDSSTFSEIPTRCFYYCSALTSVNVPSAITSLDSSAFAYCSSLEEFTVPSAVESVGDECF